MKVSKTIFVFTSVYANDVDSLIPEIWANASLAILTENMVIANLVHRDFENQIANFGDVVNTRKPAKFTAKRKTNNDNVTVQDASAPNVPVKLNQHIHVAFIIKDGEESKSMKDLIPLFLEPAMIANASLLDKIVGTQFLRTNNYAGSLGTALTSSALIDAGVMQDGLLVPDNARQCVLSHLSYGDLLKVEQFTDVNRSGNTVAQSNGYLANKYGYNLFKAQNTMSIPAGNSTLNGAINNATGYAKGTTVITVDSFTGAVTTGNWLTIGGDMTPYRITAHTETTGNTTSITLHTGLRKAVVDNAVVTTYTAGKVNFASNYAIDYAKEIVYDTFTVDPKVGHGLTFGTSSIIYGIVAVDTVNKTILLDRPLEAAVNDNDNINIFPAGNYNPVFTRGGIALVTRPLATPMQGTGARSAVASYNGLGIRVTITYDGYAQGHLVTCDFLAGVAELDADQYGVLVG